ncbi:MAG: nucleotidyltransferase [Chitinophagales bacterium]|jgi:predicted nucleotidyltransferase|nr:nucleotidyltransferase [Sphingobacteriales bacterium]
MFSPDLYEFVKLLIEKEVEYLIVGGYAVGIHGHPRYTGDLDVWINPTKENAEKVLETVNQFGFSYFNFKVEDFITEGNVIQLGNPPLRIDLLTEIDGVKFDECFLNTKEVNIDNLMVKFISYKDLIKNKLSTGRHRDLDDIENLNPPK